MARVVIARGKRPRRPSSIMKITIVIEARKKSDDDGSDVATATIGKAVRKIFVDGGDDWTHLNGSVHQVIGVIGLSKHGRDVTITSEP